MSTPKSEDSVGKVPEGTGGKVSEGTGGKASLPEDPGPAAPAPGSAPQPESQKEIGGRGGADPTRYGDWEVNGRCVDF